MIAKDREAVERNWQFLLRYNYPGGMKREDLLVLMTLPVSLKFETKPGELSILTSSYRVIISIDDFLPITICYYSSRQTAPYYVLVVILSISILGRHP